MSEEELKDLDKEVKKLKRIATEKASVLHDLIEDRQRLAARDHVVFGNDLKPIDLRVLVEDLAIVLRPKPETEPETRGTGGRTRKIDSGSGRSRLRILRSRATGHRNPSGTLSVGSDLAGSENRPDGRSRRAGT